MKYLQRKIKKIHTPQPLSEADQYPIFTYHPQIMETSTFTIFRAILLGGTSSSSSFQADICALTEQEAKELLLQMAEREPGFLFDIMRQNTPRTVGSAVAANWSLSRNDQWQWSQSPNHLFLGPTSHLPSVCGSNLLPKLPPPTIF